MPKKRGLVINVKPASLCSSR